MEKLSDIARFKERQNIILEGFDPVSAGGFTQVPNFIINHKGLSPTAKIVYAKLLSYAWHNNRVFPGQDTLAEELGMVRKTVYTALTELQREGFLEVERRGLGLTNTYKLYHTVKKRS